MPPRPASITRTVVVANQKGGVGKTTTAVNLAAGLAGTGLRVLLIDMDPQGNSTFAVLGAVDPDPTVYQLLLADDLSLTDVVQTTAIEGLDILPSDINLAGAEVELLGAVGSNTRLRSKLQHASHYDYVVIDTPPSGLRVSELIRLQLSDIRIAERSGSLVVRAGKGGKRRELPLNIDVRRALQDYLEVRPTTKDPWVFLSQKGGRLSAAAVQKLVGKYARRAQLEDVTPHTLRHSFAEDVLDHGESLSIVAALLGHENLQTAAIYTQAEPS